jgi:hypothetical protein
MIRRSAPRSLRSPSLASFLLLTELGGDRTMGEMNSEESFSRQIWLPSSPWHRAVFKAGWASSRFGKEHFDVEMLESDIPRSRPPVRGN